MSGQWPSERSRGIPPCATHAWCLPPPRLRHSTVATYKAAQDGLVGAHLSHPHAGVARRPTQACHPSRFRGAAWHRPKSGADVLSGAVNFQVKAGRVGAALAADLRETNARVRNGPVPGPR